MIDLNRIEELTPFIGEEEVSGIVELRAKYKRTLTIVETRRSERKSITDPDTGRAHREELKALEAELAELKCLVDWNAHRLRNIPLPVVPIGESEDDNRLVYRTEDDLPTYSNDHMTIAARCMGVELEQTANMSGSRMTTLRGEIARLERALGQFMLNKAYAGGWEEYSVPALVKPHAMFGTGQFPKFEEDAYQTTDGSVLVPTAEVSLTNLVSGILYENKPEIRMAALTPCFRREAGSAGRDTRGLIRQHQFQKVELVSVVGAEDSEVEHQRMCDHVSSVLSGLGLPYQIVELCTGDMGFSAARTFDFEVWFPSQGKFREISSVSNCTDFQARRMNTRYRTESGTQLVHTLNGSGVAVGRALAAVLENYQRENYLVIPEALVDLMDSEVILFE